MTKDIGVVYLCRRCIQDRNIGLKQTDLTVPPGSACLLCLREEDLVQCVASMANPYLRSEWVTQSSPEGQPWWLTGSLKDERRG